MRFPAKKQAVEQHHRDAYADGAVSDIEGGPMPSADVEIEKINNRTEANPIDDIADRTADDQTDCGGEQWAADSAEPIDQHGDDRCSDERE